MATAAVAGAYGVEYLSALLAPVVAVVSPSPELLALPGVPEQAAMDRLLSSYETWVQVETATESARAVPA
jgi:hypothetical protein